MFAVGSERDRVIIDLCGRRRDLMLSVREAHDFAEALDLHAADASRGPDSLIRGEIWDVKVESYDGLVAVRFLPPLGNTATRVPVPHEAARRLAEVVRFKAQQAEYLMRLVFANQRGRGGEKSVK